MVGPAVVIEGGDDAEGNPDNNGEGKGVRREFDRSWDPRAKLLCDRRPLGNGFSPVASKQVADVIDVLNGQWLVEPPTLLERRADLRVVCLTFAQYCRDWIAGHRVSKNEGRNAHDHKDEQRQHDASGYEYPQSHRRLPGVECFGQAARMWFGRAANR